MEWNANLLREPMATRSPSWSPRPDSPSARDATLCANCGSNWTRPSHVILPLCVYNARRAWPMCALLAISQRKPNEMQNAKPLSTHTTPESANSPALQTILNPVEHEILCIVDRNCAFASSYAIHALWIAMSSWMTKRNEEQRLVVVDDLRSHSSLGFGFGDQGKQGEALKSLHSLDFRRRERRVDLTITLSV